MADSFVESIGGGSEQDFLLFWSPIPELLRRRGWTTFWPFKGPNDCLHRPGLEVREGVTPRLCWAWLDPFLAQEDFRIRLHFHEDVNLDDVQAEFERAALPFREHVRVRRNEDGDGRPVLEVLIPKNMLFGNIAVESMMQRIADFAAAVIDRAG